MSDYIVRATAADAQVRAFACTTRDTVETARDIHHLSPVVTAALGRLLSAGAMMGITLKGERDLLTLQIRGEGPVRGLLVTADAGGQVKGYANVPDVILPANARGKLDVSGAVGPGILCITKDMGLKEPYVGQIALQTGEIAEDLTYYFAVSEQIPSTVGLGVLMNRDNTVAQAGGFLIQLMPFAGDDVITRLEENLAGISSVTQLLSEGRTPEQILGQLLDGMNPEMNEITPTGYYCNCSRQKVEKALISVGKKELKDMIAEEKDVELNCHFCNKNYVFKPEELKILVKNA